MTSPDEGAVDGFNPTIHAPNRLRICALLDVVEQAEFSAIQNRLGVSASVLSKHVSVLMEAGFVQQHRATRDTRQRGVASAHHGRSRCLPRARRRAHRHRRRLGRLG